MIIPIAIVGAAGLAWFLSRRDKTREPTVAEQLTARQKSVSVAKAARQGIKVAQQQRRLPAGLSPVAQAAMLAQRAGMKAPAPRGAPAVAETAPAVDPVQALAEKGAAELEKMGVPADVAGRATQEAAQAATTLVQDTLKSQGLNIDFSAGRGLFGIQVELSEPARFSGLGDPIMVIETAGLAGCIGCGSRDDDR